ERRPGLEHLTLLGPPERLTPLVQLFDIERVVIAFSNESHEDVLTLVRSLKNLNVQIDIVPRLFEVVGPNVGVHTVEGLPLVGLPPVRISRSSRALKRALDVAGAIVGLVLTAPLFLYIALRIKRDSSGPVFFRQVRLGTNMREFEVLKFRTMKTGTDETPHRDYVKTLMARDVAPTENGLFKLSRDDSVTSVGRWLRKTSLDELPQLVNVLRGEMSLVGPRPLIAEEDQRIQGWDRDRLRLTPGMTGQWQISGPMRPPLREMVTIDYLYVTNWSLWTDIKILLRTAAHVCGRRGQ
ncbi:MAG: hypothetical protein QOG11_834, partial [Solirubrobacteraceae bacterium]|nr:hypothetical protein [Solirubrobacteraceae bacterium]